MLTSHPTQTTANLPHKLAVHVLGLLLLKQKFVYTATAEVIFLLLGEKSDIVVFFCEKMLFLYILISHLYGWEFECFNDSNSITHSTYEYDS